MSEELEQLLLRNARLEEATTNAVLSAEAALRSRATASERPLPDYAEPYQPSPPRPQQPPRESRQSSAHHPPPQPQQQHRHAPAAQRRQELYAESSDAPPLVNEVVLAADKECRLLRARVKALEGDLREANVQLRSGGECISRLEKEVQTLGAEKIELLRANKELLAALQSQKRGTEELSTALRDKTAQLNALKAERTDLTRKTKTVEQALESKEVLLSRAAAEVEKQKSQLAAEREFLRTELDKSRALAKSLQDKLRGSERKKMELLVAVKKQKRLLDVLRQQVAVLDSAAAVRGIEEEVADFGVGESGSYGGGGGGHAAGSYSPPRPPAPQHQQQAGAAGWSPPHGGEQYGGYAAAPRGAQQGEYAEYDDDHYY